ncbi:MAG: thymidine phosphorylase [Defluviitaleaceae bacterium]|nr:thymidine phosphorylase [Defluviitaleaceae bacterium]
MRIYDVINKKKRGGILSAEEIIFTIEGFTRGEIPDYQMSALLMAIYFNGMNAAETAALTMAMVRANDAPEPENIANILSYEGKIIDKHSTGGVGDKTTLAVVPIVAACGVPIAKMSGRGLGHTGGTIDKLEAIPNFKTNLSCEEFYSIIKLHGLCIAGQSKNLAPADKKIYALRDVTATVDSIPLIAASIMSKKIAAGADAILLDVKTGSGAFMKSYDEACKLAQAMVDIGNACGRKTAAIITDMSAPLGCAIGNSVELREIILFLRNKKNFLAENLFTLCEELATQMLVLAEKDSEENCRATVREVVANGKALQKFYAMVEAQGGDLSFVEYLSRDDTKREIGEKILSPESGFISEIDAEGIGISAMILGAGRQRPEEKIDYSAGIELKFKRGSFVEKNETLAELFTSNKNLIPDAREKFLQSLSFSQEKPREIPLIYEKIGG